MDPVTTIGPQHNTTLHPVCNISWRPIQTISKAIEHGEMKVKAMRGCSEDKLSGYLNEFIYKARASL